MIYQVRTFKHLCGSKVFPKSKEEIFKHLDKVISCTNEFRSKWPEELLRLCGWATKVTKKEIQESIEITKLETEQYPFINNIFCNGEIVINATYLKLTIESEIKREIDRQERLKNEEELKLSEDKKNEDSKPAPERRVLRRIHRTGGCATDPSSVSSCKEKEKKVQHS